MSEEIIYFYNIEDDKYYRSRYTHQYLDNLIKENKQLKEQLQKSEEVIENAIQFLDAISLDKTDKYIAIRDYEEYRILLDILNKYKKEECK